ncbi:MAG TPA: hypothetical protein VF157_10290 [Chloroflexota bacterium]
MATTHMGDIGTAPTTYTETAQPGSMATAMRDARYLMRFVFTVAPIIAGVDKLLYLVLDKSFLVDWYQYLWPAIKGVGINDFVFSLVVGIIEVVAGLVVAFRPDFGGYLVTAWLWGIVINLLLIPGYYDIALRDFGLSLGALSLARLSWPFYHGLAETHGDMRHQESVREYASPPTGA